ncbi:MAG: GNAT family N-acetyltransferase [Paenibacillaceae bacterium]|uniref:GNAT family N-acetyltransferase n=1 Tax=Paenibacillus cymbidii TaxID=1639034 RepID=UPI0010810BFC|nr:GNAT family N-acetyltransferase [Paenibacillus cymbidii]MBO9605474.1 GNAT family N-acetyltransferase [Paenibacillaceae bacterium]
MEQLKQTASERSYLVQEMENEAQAQRIGDFFLSPHSFDDQRYTPGEQEMFRNRPRQSLHQGGDRFWFVENERGEVIGACNIKENEHRTGGYMWDFIAVHRQYRNLGIARRLYDTMIAFVRSRGGRYILTYTCDLPEYAPIQRMFEGRGFTLVGTCPDYYYDGEAMLLYNKKL